MIQQFGGRAVDLWCNRINRKAEQNVLDALTQLLQEHRATLEEDSEIQKILLKALSETSDPDIAQYVQRYNRRVYLIIYQLIERTQEEGYMRAM